MSGGFLRGSPSNAEAVRLRRKGLAELLIHAADVIAALAHVVDRERGAAGRTAVDCERPLIVELRDRAGRLDTP